MVTDAQGCTITSEKVSMTMIEVSAVSTLEVNNVLSTTASLDWNNASPSGYYHIRYSDDGGSTWTVISDHLGSSINLSGLSPSTTYDVEIISSSYGCESDAYSSSFTTEEDCIAPLNISLSATPVDVTLSWDELVGADSYKIVYKLPNSGWQSVEVTDNFLTLSTMAMEWLISIYVQIVLKIISQAIPQFNPLSCHLVHYQLM